ncbi:MAG: permease-like cell division protein FtsX [Bacilli bacterium]
MMKLFRMLGRNFRDALKSVIRNFSLSLASISCITITLVVVALSIILSYNVNNFSNIIKKDVTIVVFIENDATDQQIAGLENTIKNDKNVDSYKFYSKSEVAEEIMQHSDIYKTIMEEWNDKTNPLYDEFWVKVKDIEIIDQTAQKIKDIKIVKTVEYGETIINKLLSTFKVIQNISYILVISLLIVTAFLISNTIKLTIHARRKEISIMRLVGASNMTIRLPFVIEGLFLGILGSIIPIIITIYGYYVVYNYYGGQLFSPLIRLISPEPFVYIIALILLGIGVIVGMGGSYKAVRRHLKV